MMIHSIEAEVALPAMSKTMPFDCMTDQAFPLQNLRIYLFFSLSFLLQFRKVFRVEYVMLGLFASVEHEKEGNDDQRMNRQSFLLVTIENKGVKDKNNESVDHIIIRK